MMPRGVRLCLLVPALIVLGAGATVVIDKPNDEVSSTPTPPQVKKNQEGMNQASIPAAEKNTKFWRDTAHNILKEKLETKTNLNKAVNGILFIGDGMSVATLMAARTYAGQLNNKPGEETELAFETFPVSGLAKTYCIDAQVADSACTATAYLTGVKTKYGTIGLSPNVTRGVCNTQLYKGNWLSSIASWALERGLDAGIVTTTRVTHASPAGAYAHIAERDWESDAETNKDALKEGCNDIAYQLVAENPGRSFKVILGGGRRAFLPNITTSPAATDAGGIREDGVDLTEIWRIDKLDKNVTHEYVKDKTGLQKILNADEDQIPEYLLGLFTDSHMEYHLKIKESEQPTLAEMTEAAIKVLSRNPKGYFLFVEGGRIDHAHHDNLAYLAMDETVEYSKAVQKAREMTSEDDTLIVVSSDHAHTMTVSGYASRGTDILGVVDTKNASDGMPYTVLSYANGPGKTFTIEGNRIDLTTEEMFMSHNLDYKYPNTAPLDSETHGGEDVAVFASGPWQHLFTSTYEQNAIPHLMAYSMCLGPEKHANCYVKSYKSNSSCKHVLSIVTLMAVIVRFVF